MCGINQTWYYDAALQLLAETLYFVHFGKSSYSPPLHESLVLNKKKFNGVTGIITLP